MQLGSVLVLPNIDLQADFSIQLTDFQSVVVLQGKQSMLAEEKEKYYAGVLNQAYKRAKKGK